MTSKNPVLFVLLLVAAAGCSSGGADSSFSNELTPNLAPVVNAGVDTTIRLPDDTVALDGTVTDDGRPASGSVSTSWVVQSGPAGAVFTDVNAIDTTITFVNAGTYVLQLTADDTELQGSDNVTVVVEDAPVLSEIAVAPADVTLFTGETQTFNASGLDQYGDSFAVNVTWSATGGTINQAGDYVAGNTTGAYDVTATDGAVNGNAGVTIAASPPTADAGGPYAGPEGSVIALDGSASTDPNNDIATYAWDLDNDGAYDDAVGVSTNFSAVSSGIFTIGLQVTDADGDSGVATAVVTVANVAPTANAQSVSTAEDTPLPIMLTGSDPGADPLTFAIATGPSNGTLSGTAPNIIYTPSSNYSGPDSFTFTADDGEFTSTAATVSITVSGANDGPTASPQSVSTDEDTALPITLAGTDPESDPLTYAIDTGPSNGTLSGTAPNVTYTPNADYNGPDSFTFTVDDGEFTSAAATVSITVSGVNDAPTASPQSASTAEDTALPITLAGTDPESDPLTYAIDTGPGNGTLSGTAPNVTYTPNADYNGPDSFTFTVDDGEFTSTAATVSITVSGVNDAPTASAQSVSTAENTALPITLAGTDPESDPLTYAIDTGPGNGTLSGTAPNVTYTPNADYNGPDSFTFTVDDGEFTSTAATVSITVSGVNDAPTASAQSVSTAEDTALPITLAGTDPESDLLTYAIDTGPGNGTLSGTAPNVTYTPNADYNGPDSFTFTVDDGEFTSTAATVSITVTAVNDAPTASPQSVSTDQVSALPITLAGSDTESDPLTYAIDSGPSNGTLSGTPPNVTYVSNGSVGSDSFTFTVDDGDITSAAATVSITVSGTSGLAAYWKADEGAGTVMADANGVSNGTLVGTGWAAGASGTALNFNGTSDYVAIDNSAALDITGTEITLAAWIYPRSGGTEFVGSRVISKRNTAGGDDVYAMYTTAYRLHFRLDGQDMVSSHIIRLNEWVHVAMVYDGVDKRIYINGELDLATPQAKIDAIDSSTSAVQLGWRENEGRYFNGRIDDAQIYDQALSPAQVQAIFDRDIPPAPAPGLSFTDITLDALISGPAAGSHGAMFAEVNNDSLPDLYLTFNKEGLTPQREFFFVNTDGTEFSEIATDPGVNIDDADGGSHGAVWADLDNDGDYDLYNGSTWDIAAPTGGNPVHDNVYENDGSGQFADITSPDILGTLIETRGVTAFDWDGDGDLDLFGVPGATFPEPNTAFRNDLDLGFGLSFSSYNVVVSDLLTTAAMQGVTDTDYDGDGDIDILAANRAGEFVILQNDGSGVFTQISPAALGINSPAGDGITTADVDNDGDLDLLLASDGLANLYIRDNAAGMYSNLQTFLDTEGYMGGFADLDNDGGQDIVFAGDVKVHLKQDDGFYGQGQSVPVSGISDPRSIAFADIDSDGDLDFAIGAAQSRNWLVRNDIDAAAGNWLRVELVSPQCQAGAFGAKTRVFAAGDLDGTLLGLRESRGNQGFLAQDEPVLHFGLGATSSVDIRVTFVDPDGPGPIPAPTVTVLGVDANQRILIDECP